MIAEEGIWFLEFDLGKKGKVTKSNLNFILQVEVSGLWSLNSSGLKLKHSCSPKPRELLSQCLISTSGVSHLA